MIWRKKTQDIKRPAVVSVKGWGEGCEKKFSGVSNIQYLAQPTSTGNYKGKGMHWSWSWSWSWYLAEPTSTGNYKGNRMQPADEVNFQPMQWSLGDELNTSMSFAFCSLCRGKIWENGTGVAKGRVASPKRLNFRKSSKWPLTPPPHFRKIMLQFFSENVRKKLYKGPKSAT